MGRKRKKVDVLDFVSFAFGDFTRTGERDTLARRMNMGSLNFKDDRELFNKLKKII